MARHHRAAALTFLEFLVTPAAQDIYAAAELEYPITANVQAAPVVAGIGSFAIDSLPIGKIAASQKTAIALVQKVGFENSRPYRMLE